MDKEMWSDWYAHDGQRIPVPHGTLCEVVTKGGEVIQDTALATVALGHMSLWIWSTLEEPFEFLAIVQYRFRRLQALDDLRGQIAAAPNGFDLNDVLMGGGNG
jgi:hypothetical protein